MFNYLSIAFRKIKKIKLAKRSIKQFEIFLKPGKYYLFPNFRVYAYNDSENCIHVTDKLGYRSSTTLWEKVFCLIGSYHVKKQVVNNFGFEGTVLYINNNFPTPLRYRVFDFKNNKVLIKYENIADYHREVEVQKYLLPFFGTPHILHDYEKDKVVVEELIPSLNRNSIQSINKVELFFKIAKSYIAFSKGYLQKTKFDTISCRDLFADMSENETVREEVFPMIPQHNDLSTLNIILDEKGVFHIIDWEHYGENIFFFDLFRWIINDFQIGNSTILMDALFKGQFDELFEQLFSVFNYRYLKNEKKKYLIIVYGMMIKKCNENGIKESEILALFSDFRKRIGRYYNEDDFN